ncbi:hypothetical protein AG1IA_04617 [Rhizoctonia solani AG-1 IA]|uniref:Uncharacterized protein n=1 Tax=Thanatephorus cucumeris (strain AG1-IA) TaxID=983506 RepID=L8WYD2_THACA|nr:hypothetical protein AG1IA_04617 [Rhizoctonia solani AG-1 IA]
MGYILYARHNLGRQSGDSDRAPAPEYVLRTSWFCFNFSKTRNRKFMPIRYTPGQ